MFNNSKPYAPRQLSSNELANFRKKASTRASVFFVLTLLLILAPSFHPDLALELSDERWKILGPFSILVMLGIATSFLEQWVNYRPVYSTETDEWLCLARKACPEVDQYLIAVREQGRQLTGTESIQIKRFYGDDVRLYVRSQLASVGDAGKN